MKFKGMRPAWVAIAAVLLVLTACSPQPAAPATAASFTDPFSYCASVGNIDKPDARYTATAVPDAIINGFKKAAGLDSSTEPMDMLRQTTIWRCMGGKVYACNFGANLPCDSRANTSKTPTQAMNEFCAANANSDFIPMAMTGHDTIYSWHCANDKAEVLQQMQQVDAAGFIQGIWYEVQPSQ